MSTSFGSWNWSSPRLPPLTKILMLYYLPGIFDTSSPGSGLPWGLCDLSCQGDNYFLWRGTLQHFCLSSQVELTVLPSAGQREKEERDATYKMKVCTRSTCDGVFEKTARLTSAVLVARWRWIWAPTPGITSECAELCWEKGTDCPNFSLDYKRPEVHLPG